MPSSLIIIGFGAFASAAAVELGATMFIGALVGGLASTVIGAALAKQAPGALEQEAAGRLATVRQPVAHWQWIYGQARVGGAVTYMETTDFGGTSNAILHMVITLAGHDVEEIGDVYFDDELLTLDGNGFVVGGQYDAHAKVIKSLGNEAGQPFPELRDSWSAGLWTDAHRQSGRAKLYVYVVWGESDRSLTYPNGIPKITAVVKGRKVLDPRYSPAVRVWSDNAALCIADYLTNADVGLGATWSELDEAKLIAAANICDENVARNLGSPTQYEKRYTLNGAFPASQAPREIIPRLNTALAGYTRFIGGKWQVCPAVYTAPSITLTADDLRGAVHVMPRLSRRDLANGVKGLYVAPENFYQATDFPPVTNATYLSDDQGERIWRELDLPFTDSAATAQRIAKIELERNRQQITVEWAGKLSCYRLQPGDTVMVTFDQLGWSAKVFEVFASTLVAEDNDGVVLGCDLVLRETASTVYDWAAGEETVVDSAPDSNLPDPFADLDVLGLTATSGTADLFVNGDGTVVPRIRLRWTPAVNTQIKRYDLQYARLDASPTEWVDMLPVSPSAREAFVQPVEDGVAYDVRIRSASVYSNTGDWSYVRAHTVIGKTELPSDVTGFSAVQSAGTIVFGCSSVPDADLDLIEIRRADLGNETWDDGEPLCNILRGQTTTSAAAPPGEWTFLSKSKDTSGNYSANVARTDLEVTSEGFTAISMNEQAPDWLGGLTNLVRHWTGVLTPQSQSMASALGWEVFDEFVPNAYTDGYYEAPTVDKSIDSPARIYGDIVSVLGPGEAGSASPTLEIDTRTSSGSFDGFEPWTVGAIQFRYLRARLHLDTTVGKAVITQFTPTADAGARLESGTLTVDGTGSGSVTFTNTFHNNPVLQLTPQGSGDVTASYTALSSSGFTGHFKSGGVAGAGTMNYTATGA